MKRSLRTFLGSGVFAFAAAAEGGAATAIHAAGRPISFELTGVVVDHAGAPMKGAYVLASYHEKVAGPAAVKQWCIRTKGMTTGADGRFHFPVEKLDGLSPAWVDAIKPGYYQRTVALPDEKVWRQQNEASYAGRRIILSPQDVGKPLFRYGSGDAFCHRAKSAADASAGIPFLAVQLDEMTKLGAEESQLKAMRGLIERLRKIGIATPGGVSSKESR